jgi:hypothetical protein
MYAVSVFTLFINIPPIALGLAVLLILSLPILFFYYINKLEIFNQIAFIPIIFVFVLNIMLFGYYLHANKALLNVNSPKYICNNKEYKCLDTETYSILLIKIFSIICFIQTIIYIILIVFCIISVIFEDYINKNLSFRFPV